MPRRCGRDTSTPTRPAGADRGYDRHNSRAAFTVLKRLYGLLGLQLNFFRPVRTLVSKHRIGSKLVKI